MRVVLAEHQLMTGAVNLEELRRILRKTLRASTAQTAIVEAVLRDYLLVADDARFASPRAAWELLRGQGAA
jgi:hypothetical protein